MLDDRAERDLAQLLPVKAELLDQRAERADRHAEVADVGIRGVLLAEGDADAAEDGDGTAVQHRMTSSISARCANRYGHNAPKCKPRTQRGQSTFPDAR